MDLPNKNTLCGRDAHRLIRGPLSLWQRGMRERLLARVSEADSDRAPPGLHCEDCLDAALSVCYRGFSSQMNPFEKYIYIYIFFFRLLYFNLLTLFLWMNNKGRKNDV